MATPFLGLRTAGYQVPDLQKAKQWYTGILKAEPYFDEPFYVGYNIAGYELGLVPTEAGYFAAGTPNITYWGVENVQAVYNALLLAGATPYEEPHDVGGDIVVAAVKDPWGNAFGIIYNPHFKL